MMLPKLKGLAGDYMFDELSFEEHSNYKVLIKHLKHHFSKLASAKHMSQCFGGRTRKSQTEEAYAAELKCIYGKAYLKHDYSAWDEDLLCRFLKSLTD